MWISFLFLDYMYILMCVKAVHQKAFKKFWKTPRWCFVASSLKDMGSEMFQSIISLPCLWRKFNTFIYNKVAVSKFSSRLETGSRKRSNQTEQDGSATNWDYSGCFAGQDGCELCKLFISQLFWSVKWPRHHQDVFQLL